MPGRASSDVIIYRRRPALVRYVTTQEKILKNRPMPGRLSISTVICKSLKSYGVSFFLCDHIIMFWYMTLKQLNSLISIYVQLSRSPSERSWVQFLVLEHIFMFALLFWCCCVYILVKKVIIYITFCKSFCNVKSLLYLTYCKMCDRSYEKKKSPPDT